jgi:hypothetical protein
MSGCGEVPNDELMADVIDMRDLPVDFEIPDNHFVEEIGVVFSEGLNGHVERIVDVFRDCPQLGADLTEIFRESFFVT